MKSPESPGIPSDVLRAMPHHGNTEYTPEDRWNAALHWSILGNIQAVARRTGIPADTVQKWSETEWWALLLNQVGRMYQAQLDAKLTGIIDKSLTETLDRLDNGDIHVFEGRTTRAPVKARDAMVIGAMAYDKRALLRGQATSRTERVNLHALRADFREVIEGNPEHFHEMLEPKRQTPTNSD